MSLLPGEVVLKIAGKTHYLWRAVDQHGVVLDVLVQSRRNKKAAKRLLRKLLKRQCRAPRVMITEVGMHFTHPRASRSMRVRGQTTTPGRACVKCIPT